MNDSEFMDNMHVSSELTRGVESGNDTMKLFTYRLIDGRFATYAGVTEAAAFRRAYQYHREAVLGIEPLHHVCRCESKAAKSVREGGWLICDRSECAGYIG